MLGCILKENHEDYEDQTTVLAGDKWILYDLLDQGISLQMIASTCKQNSYNIRLLVNYVLAHFCYMNQVIRIYPVV